MLGTIFYLGMLLTTGGWARGYHRRAPRDVGGVVGDVALYGGEHVGWRDRRVVVNIRRRLKKSKKKEKKRPTIRPHALKGMERIWLI